LVHAGNASLAKFSSHDEIKLAKMDFSKLKYQKPAKTWKTKTKQARLY
jgi:hypothetical protein